MKNNYDFVNYVTEQVGQAYWYGTYGQIATIELLNKKSIQYKNYYTKQRIKYAKENHLGKKVFDCSGLIKSFLWEKYGIIKYNKETDYSSNKFYEESIEKGKIKDLPEIPGLLLYKKDHIGVYIGNGYVVEAKGFNYGVVKSRLIDTKWTNYAKLKFINYDNFYEVKKGDTLIKIGKKLNIDWKKLYEKNKSIIGDNPDLIRIGIKLNIMI